MYFFKYSISESDPFDQFIGTVKKRGLDNSLEDINLQNAHNK